jgi:hypothetical protein
MIIHCVPWRRDGQVYTCSVCANLPFHSSCLVHVPSGLAVMFTPCQQISKGSGSVFGVHPGPTRKNLIDLALTVARGHELDMTWT